MKQIWHHYCKSTSLIIFNEKENFEQVLQIKKLKMSRNKASQKNTNQLFGMKEDGNIDNMLVNSDIRGTNFNHKILDVNKMLSMLIFLMVK
jgi:hypothetical protein